VSEGFNKSELASMEGLLRGQAATLGFREVKRGLYSLALGGDTMAFIDFRGTWKGWRYAYKGNRALSEEELMEIEPLKRFKELRDRIISHGTKTKGGVSMASKEVKGVDGEAGKGMILPVAGVRELSEGLKLLVEVKSTILEEDDYVYLDENGNRVSRNMAVVRRLRKSGLRKLAYAYGLDFFIIGVNRHNVKGSGDGHYTWLCHALVVEPRSDRWVESIGACSSGDLFFSRTPSEADVILRAQTMAVGRGIADLLGLGVEEVLGGNAAARTRGMGKRDRSF
jgi:hypothetical protein